MKTLNFKELSNIKGGTTVEAARAAAQAALMASRSINNDIQDTAEKTDNNNI